MLNTEKGRCSSYLDRNAIRIISHLLTAESTANKFGNCKTKHFADSEKILSMFMGT